MGRAYGKAEVVSDEEDGELEVEGVVQVIVIDDNRGREHDPDRDDHGRRQLGLGLLGRGGARQGAAGDLVALDLLL
jgi:hypothetical protein